jgi:hypothetical protein
MEMTFPHQALRQDSVNRRLDHRHVLAVAMARQANCRTVAALRRAECGDASAGDEMAQRIHYFGRRDGRKVAVRGAFWRDVAPEPDSEATVYQCDLAYVKDGSLDREATGEQLNHAGHGTLRTI